MLPVLGHRIRGPGWRRTPPRCHEIGQTGLGLPPCQEGPVMAPVQTAFTYNLKEKALCHLLPLGLLPESPVETPPVCPR